MSTARTRTLREIAQLNPRAAQLEPEDEVAFVGMADLDDVSARTTSDTRRPYSEVSKGYTPFRNGDLLAAKITPCWQNGKIGVATLDVEHGVGSTEFHVIRPDDEVNPRYLLHFLRTPEVRETGTLRMTGSGGQRRVPLKFMSDLQVPLPQAEVQHRIASILDEADAIRTKRRAQLAHLDELPQVLFHGMFGGEPGTTTLAEVASFFGGSSLPPSIPFDGQAGGSLLTKVSDMNLSGNETRIHRTVGWTSQPTARASTVPAGAVVLPKRGAAIATNKKRITTRQSALDPNLMGVMPNTDKALTDYLFEWFRSFNLSSITSGSSVPQLNKKDLSPLALPLPPLAEQRVFSEKLTAIDAERDRVARALDADDELFAALQHRAFRGEL